MNGESKQRGFRSVLPEETRTKDEDEDEDDWYMTLNTDGARALALLSKKAAL